MISLRPYQQRIVDQLRLSLRRYRSTLIVLPTGGGKTYLSCGVIEMFLAKNRPGIVMMHREELIQQWVKSLGSMGIYAGAIKAGVTPSPSLPVQVASVQTLIRREPLPPEKVQWIFVDEAHRIKAKSYLSILEKYPNAYIIGVTATPVRSDGQGLGDVFNDMIVGTSKLDLIKQGFLVPSKIYSNPLDPDLLRKISVRAGDYNKEDIGDLMMDDRVMSGLWSSWKSHAYGNMTLAFAATVDQSMQMKRLFESHGIPSGHIDGKTKKKDRARILRDFAEGRITYLTNVGVLTEGYDNPGIECVQLARPTKSYGLYNQMVGRGARPCGNKKHYILLDHGNNVIEHSIPEDEPEWSLKKGAIKKDEDDQKSYVVRMKSEDGDPVVVTARQLPMIREDIELVAIDTTFRRDVIEKCLDYARGRGHKTSSAWYNFAEGLKRSNDKPSLPEIHYFRKKLGYDGRWVKYKCKELGIKTL